MAWKSVSLSVAAAVLFAASNAVASIQYDANVTSDVIYGTGNANGGFTREQNNGVEVALRTHQRFPAANIFNSNGDGTYTWPTGNFGPGGTNFQWNFDWSINTNYDGTTGFNVGDLTYEIRIDFDPSFATSFLTFDPIIPGPADHSFGTNATGNGAGLEAPGDDTYANLLAGNNLVQNSWRHTFFGPVDPTANGIYDIELSAYRGTGMDRVLLSEVGIQVINGVVPEPATLVTWGGLALAAGGFWVRKKNATA